jgi:hypothetical protein
MDIRKGTAAPFTMEVAGKVWTVRPPSFLDMGTFEAWSEGELLKQAASIAASTGALVPVPRGPAASLAMWKTGRGQAAFVVIVLKASQPEVTAEALSADGWTADDIERVAEAAMEAASPETKPAEGKQGEPFRLSL